ncbi:Methyltransferase domain-containing protein [Streptoalloteichus tenebrarius]|uniref:Methyltransferase domain-containing protein n=1 Tax=Streptoalloteichus tenebrarius (strain ATCC 17920 / DSM 40477 / JCM 4838 / CBS 697.72 / NBRC 16177 / NCIMB 11028 / NRRL B-12390 / A12253. 1 / ISP 5477) TaxID=1933 RepID=A0ABT1HQ42_STRSD|nr:class I SAM-dependent methyltransferase [Streptoalloteichus tenebrarius]MCP2257624.1 Methyltransferase domain-containing protein [Streptoalloteichus tenebrarius]BFE98583.1 methyltransferase domain-containing protein [Streptoalloteichus tenebrarius]
MNQASDGPGDGEPTAGYTALLGHHLPTELDRLRALEETFDPTTNRVLTELGVGPGWRCLELGAGGGSVARWLRQRCGPGAVVVTDLDTRLLEDLGDGVEVLRHDLTRDDFPEAGFDLVHARAVLMHLPDPRRQLERITRWVAPGGWLVVEDPVLHLAESSPHPEYHRMVAVLREFLTRGIGSDFVWARALPRHFAELGLVDLRLTPMVAVVGTGGSPDRMWRLLLEQIGEPLTREGVATAADVRGWRDLFDDPSFVDLNLTMVSMAGRRPPRP